MLEGATISHSQGLEADRGRHSPTYGVTGDRNTKSITDLETPNHIPVVTSGRDTKSVKTAIKMVRKKRQNTEFSHISLNESVKTGENDTQGEERKQDQQCGNSQMGEGDQISETVDNGQKSKTGGSSGNMRVKQDVDSGNKSVTVGAGKESVTVGADKESVTVGAEKESVMDGADKESVNVGADKESVTVGAGQERVTVGAEKESVTVGAGKKALTEKLAAKAGHAKVKIIPLADLNNVSREISGGGKETQIPDTDNVPTGDTDLSGGTPGASVASSGPATNFEAKCSDRNNNELGTLTAKRKVKQNRGTRRARKCAWPMSAKGTSPVELQPNKGPLGSTIHSVDVYNYESEEDFMPSQRSPHKGALPNHRIAQSQRITRNRAHLDTSPHSKTVKRRRLSHAISSSAVSSVSPTSTSTNPNSDNSNNSVAPSSGRYNIFLQKICQTSYCWLARSTFNIHHSSLYQGLYAISRRDIISFKFNGK